MPLELTIGDLIRTRGFDEIGQIIKAVQPYVFAVRVIHAPYDAGLEGNLLYLHPASCVKLSPVEELAWRLTLPPDV